MKRKELKQLKVGHRVYLLFKDEYGRPHIAKSDNKEIIAGTVIKKNWLFTTVKWDNDVYNPSLYFSLPPNGFIYLYTYYSKKD